MHLFYLSSLSRKHEALALARIVSGACILLLCVSLSAFGESAKTAVSCDALAKLVLPEVTITKVEAVAAGAFKAPSAQMGGGPGGPGGPNGQAGPGSPAGGPGGQTRPGGQGGPPPGGGMAGPFEATDATKLPAFCRIEATLEPSADSDIKTEFWLPLEGWNGKFMGVGNWGWGGSIMYGGLEYGLKNGYAAASNDTGHAGGAPGAFALGHPDKVLDYGFRANHEMTLDAKEIIKDFYGSAPKHSYFVGCSLGGQQAMTEVQRFPDDYDGIVAGSPASPIGHLNAFQIWPALLAVKSPDGVIPQSKSAMIHAAEMKDCDELDGVKDNIIENPEACRFDPAELLCKGADAADCLTAPQVKFLQTVYTGAHNSRTGDLIYAPLAIGDEFMALDTNPMGNATALFKYLVFQDPNWDWKTFNMDTDVDLSDRVLSVVNGADNPNLKPFFDRGGKLLMYQGWSDPSSPRQSFNYYERVLKTVGPQTADSMRVFAMPGVGHCMGGLGCDAFDKLAVIDRWVESGKAPDRIVASKISNGKAIRTHPLCAYPMVAKYKGTGSTEDAENFACGK